jgi:hypothetical protein
MASRVAAELKKEADVQVETVRGGLGEFSVHLDDRKVIDTNRLWYPTPSKVVKKIKALLAE